MEYRQEVLDIIDSYTIEQEERKTKLKQLAEGKPYAYMLDSFYPSLRNAGYLQVYYDIDRTASIATAVTDENGRTTWIDPDSPENIGVTLINKAMKHMTAGDYETALKELETDELVQRVQYNEMPLRVEYFLTEKGRDLLPIFYAISQWGMKYIP